jgi:hypothetical protein
VRGRWCVLAVLVVSQFGCANPQASRRYHVLPTDPAGSLRLAANIGDVGLANLALRAGANVNAHDKDGVTALMLAAHGQHAPLVKALLDRGADSAIRDAEGHDALWHARGLTINGRLPFARDGFDLHLRLPRMLRTDATEVLERVTK